MLVVADTSGPAVAATARSRPMSRQTSMTRLAARRRSAGWSRGAGGGHIATERGIDERAASTTEVRGRGQAGAPAGRHRGRAGSGPMRARARTASGRGRAGGPARVGPRWRWRWRAPEPGRRRRDRPASATTLDGRRTEAQACRARDRTVGSSGAMSSAQRTRQVRGPGSSSVLSRAFWASGLRRWAELDDGHAEAPLERQSATARLSVAGPARGGSARRPLGRDAMQVGMDAELDLAAGRA